MPKKYILWKVHLDRLLRFLLRKIKSFIFIKTGGEHGIDLYNPKTKIWIGTSKKWQIVKQDIDLDCQKKKKINF